MGRGPLRWRVRFVAAVALAALALWVGFREAVLGDVLVHVRTLTAQLTVGVLRMGGMDVVRDATAVFHTNGFGIEISRGCTALPGTVLLGTAIAAYPAGRRDRWIGLAICPLAFLVINAVRLVHLMYLGAHGSVWFGPAHEIFWQAGMALACVGLWMVWRWWASRHAVA